MGKTKEMAMEMQEHATPTMSQPCVQHMDMSMVAKINEKIQRCAQDIGKMAQDGTNTFSKYKYISNVAMVGAMRDKLLRNKLSIIPSVVDFTERDLTVGNKPAIRTTVTMAFQITDLETGYSMIESFIGAEQDTGGKSMQQAVTQCCKYFYFKLFNVSSQDEIDGDEKTETQGQPQPSKKVEKTPKLTAKQVDAILGQSDEYRVEVLRKIDDKELSATTKQYNQIKQSIKL